MLVCETRHDASNLQWKLLDLLGVRAISSRRHTFEQTLDGLRQSKRTGVGAFERSEKWPKTHERVRGLIGRTLWLTLETEESALRNLSTRRIAAEEMKNAWTGFAADKLAGAFAGRAEIVAL